MPPTLANGLSSPVLAHALMVALWLWLRAQLAPTPGSAARHCTRRWRRMRARTKVAWTTCGRCSTSSWTCAWAAHRGATRRLVPRPTQRRCDWGTVPCVWLCVAVAVAVCVRVYGVVTLPGVGVSGGGACVAHQDQNRAWLCLCLCACACVWYVWWLMRHLVVLPQEYTQHLDRLLAPLPPAVAGHLVQFARHLSSLQYDSTPDYELLSFCLSDAADACPAPSDSPVRAAVRVAVGVALAVAMCVGVAVAVAVWWCGCVWLCTCVWLCYVVLCVG